MPGSSFWFDEPSDSLLAGIKGKEDLEKKELRKKIISIAAAGVISALFLYFGYRNVDAEIEDRHWDVIALGDSIIGKEREGEAVHAYFEEYSGMTMLNAAFGGNCASVGENAGRYSYHEESLSLCALAKAACGRDFGVQKADMGANALKAWYFEDALEGLAAADFSQADILLLEFGVNDYTAGRKIDNPDDPLDVRTYGGAVRYAIQLFQETYPNLEIILVTPTFCQIVDCENCLKEDFGGGTLDKYADKEKEIAADYGLGVIDVFYEIGFCEENIMDYTEDGMHLDNTGRQYYARFLAEKIEELSERNNK